VAGIVSKTSVGQAVRHRPHSEQALLIAGPGSSVMAFAGHTLRHLEQVLRV